MKISAPNLNHLWAQLMIEELIRNGVEHFFIAPGSRSTPLALAVAGHKRAKMIVHFDERGIAFAALGCARATGVPAAVITTSGTAVANLFPAVIEASMDHVPMVVLTGDRPPELRDCGANQAIDQVKIFGDYARWFFDIPCPDEKISPRFVLTTIDQAVARAANGPVHLNCQFREPLAPKSQQYNRKAIEADISRWLKSESPYTRYSSSVQMTTHGELMEAIRPRKKVRGLIVAAELRNLEEATAVQKLGVESGWPIVGDIRSHLRLGGKKQTLSRVDHLLLSEKFAESYIPEVVLQFGSRLVSKRLQEWLNQIEPEVYAVVDAMDGRIDSGHRVTHRWNADIAWAANCLAPRLAKSGPKDWVYSWSMIEVCTLMSLSMELDKHDLCEPWILAAVTQMIPERQQFVLSSSMPVRDAEMYAMRSGKFATVIANRGASGIDGTVATAVGAALGGGEGVTLVIGDLAFLHDLNSLAMIREVKKPFIIVAINNDGGAIFSFLPIAKHPEHFEKIFGTPHGLGFENAAKMFGIEYVQPTTAKDFECAYHRACQRGGATLIEVRTNREDNVRIHREIQDAVRKAVDQIA